MSSFLYRLGQAAARHRWRTLGIWIAAVVAIFVIGGALGGKFSDDFNLPDSESQRAYDLLAERYPAVSGTSAYIVFHTPNGPLEDQADAVSSTLDAIAGQPHVIAVMDPFETPGALSPDGTIGYAQVAYDQPAVDMGIEPFEALQGTLGDVRSPDLEAEIGGEYASWGTQPETRTSELIGLLAAMIILLIAFGSVVAMGLPIATAVIGLATGTGLALILAAFTSVPEFATFLSSMIGLGVGIDYALFIVTRYRQNLHDGMEPLHAIGVASSTAGQAVVFSGIIVSFALLGLWISGITFVGMMATAAAIVVLVAVVAAITLLPALLGFAGNSIDKLSVHRKRKTEEELEPTKTPMWTRWGHEVERHPWRYFVSAAAVLVVLAIPLFSMKLGFPDDGTAPTSETRRLAYDLLSEGFGPGFNGPLLLAVELNDPAALGELDQLTSALASAEGVAAVTPPQPNEAGDAAIIQVIPTTSPQDQATTDLVERLRDETIPAATPDGAIVHVGGGTATFIDLSERIWNALPWFIAAVVLLSFLLLMVVFRSILVPLKAAVLNLLSISAAYGVVVVIFQWGWGRSLLGIDQLIPIVSFVPMMMFAVLFGLSMDYEIFLLSRIREEYLKTGKNVESVVSGISTTARVITSAALIMIAVFLSFVIQPDPVGKMFGIGLAVAVLIDATIVRIVLVPATMVLLGDLNWWLPGWLDRILPKMSLESASDPEAAEEEPVPVG
jgi:RND superfamily putative drug exporter